jgi:hypothetical protein
MLSTKEKAGIIKQLDTDNHLIWTPNYYWKLTKNWEYQHLYILSNDEIKKDNWYLFDNMINKADTDYSLEVGKFIKAKKIIASTNSSLSINQCDGCNAGIPVNKNNIHEAAYPSGSMVCQKHKYEFPKLPLHFIEYYVNEYNKGNVIKEVMIEYKPIGNWRHTEFIHTKDILKLNLDNTINIKLIKECWTREEVIKLLEDMYYACDQPFVREDLDEWIKDNL